MDVREEGIVILVKDEHLEKAQFPIETTELGIRIYTNDEHNEKAQHPIEVTEE